MSAPVDIFPSATGHFAATRLERVFADCFSQTLRTRLEGGQEEPLYIPAATICDPHRLIYREDFFASALHEVAHWCIAGQARREKVDFGYWYAPDGRSAQQQEAFEAVEDKPQALEWYFCKASTYRFRISADNLNGLDGARYDNGPFQRRILAQARQWQRLGLPTRAATFYLGLCREFGTHTAARDLAFDLAELD